MLRIETAASATATALIVTSSPDPGTWPVDQFAAVNHEESPALPVRVAAQVVATLAAAVDHAHRHGVVHRDLKPSNALLQWRPGIDNADGVPGRPRWSWPSPR